MPLAAAGCGIDLGPYDDEPRPAPCGGATSCAPADPPESVCRAYLTAEQAEDGCGVFVSDIFGDDENPGTRDKPVRSLPRGIALARTGRGRVFFCGSHSGAITLPSGVDLIGSFDCLNEWKRKILSSDSVIQTSHDAVALTIEPAAPGDTGAADGVSTLVNLRVVSGWEVGLFVRSGTAVEIVRSAIHGNHGFRTEPGEDAPKFPLAPDGTHGNPGVEGCSATPAIGGAPVMTSCDGGAVSIGGKGATGGLTTLATAATARPCGARIPRSIPGAPGGAETTAMGAAGTGNRGRMARRARTARRDRASGASARMAG